MMVSNVEEKGKLLWEVCGHGKIVDYLKSSIINNSVSHSYIFAGQDHLGKSTVADKFMRTLYCQGKGEYRPCGECPACQQINSRVHPDVFWVRRLTDEKTGKLKRELIIDQARELKARLSQGALLASWKVAVIEEAELLNINSANSLLKLLEEPSAKTVIILLVSDLGMVPKTVVSRCQTLNFLPVPTVEIKEFLLSKKVGEDKAEKISHLALNKPGTAVELADDGEKFSETIDDAKKFFEVFFCDLAGRLKLLDSLIDWQKDESLNIMKLNVFLDRWLLALRDFILADNGNAQLTVLGAGNVSPIKIPTERVIKAWRLIGTAKANLDYNISSKNILENLIINL
jgi:DNA polymerase-3 subunit delta'